MNRTLLALLGLFLLLAIYLFVSAPPPLPEQGEGGGGRKIPVQTLFRMLSEENNQHRGLYTRGVVGPGLKSGLKFDERWEEEGVEAGPLPALFLRATARELERTGLQVGLFLGSDYPIESSNRFNEAQMQRLEEIKRTGEPQFFHDPTVGRQTAMFADIAVAEPCVSCHNQHERSPKKDWKLGDIMGATTWSFPRDSVTLEEAGRILNAYRASARAVYQRYHDKTTRFSDTRVTVTERWPLQGEAAIPRVETFCDSVYRLSSPEVLNLLLGQ